MIQDIYPKKLINAYDPSAAPADDSFILFIEGRKIAVRDGSDEVVFPRFEEASKPEGCIYLFSIDGESFFLAPDEAVPPEGYAYIPVGDLRKKGAGPQHLIFAAFTALQLASWYRDNRFCGTCGSRTVHDSKERAVRCEKCGRVIYPRIQPAVIVGVTCGDRIILTKYNRPGGMSFYALVAGFTEIGETLEETVEREVMEEVGLKVKNIRYYKSQPWGIVDDILAGFYCDVDGDTQITMDRNELKEAVWVERKDVKGQPHDLSLTNEMMLTFRDGKEPKAQ